MILLIIFLFILISGVFIYFYMQHIEINRELDELYDMYYELIDFNASKTIKKGKITVLNRKEV